MNELSGMSETSGLSAKNLRKKFGGKTVLDDISISVSPGEIVGLLGPNGAGKTTCFHIIIGLLRPDGGIVHMNGEDISALPIHRRGRRGLAYLPQEKSIFADLTAAENVEAILELNGGNGGGGGRKENRQTALKLLHDMGVEHLANAAADTLSGGERRRVEIARLLAMRPAFVLMDEPFAAIAPIAVKDFQQIIFSLRARGIGIFVTDHNVRETLQICDRAYILDGGRTLVEGRPADIIADETARRVYLGADFGM